MIVNDLSVDIEAACAAARRYAQLVYYHDSLPRHQYRSHPVAAWRAYCRQFASIPRAATILSIIGHSFTMEICRLVGERKKGSNGQGKSPAPSSGRWHQD